MDLITPFTMLVSGQSGCGKTFWVSKMLDQVRDRFEHIVLAYTMHQSLYEVMGVELIEGFPKIIKPNTLLILDDMMLECSKEMASLFTRMRHVNVSTIFIVQNLFFDNKFMRTISRNAHYMVVFPNPRDTAMINTLGSQMFPAKPKFIVNAFLDATSVPYGYLFIDLKPNVKHRIKTGVLEDEEPCVYMCSEQPCNANVSDN
jgi:hypothetical protein